MFVTSKERKRKNKTTRRREIGKLPPLSCMSRMLVRRDDSKIIVRYFKTHNHSPTFKNTPFIQLPRLTLDRIRSDMASGVESNHIVGNFQNGIGNRNARLVGVPRKEYFITRREFGVIRRNWENRLRNNNEDSKCVERRVQTLMQEKFHSVLVYKPQGLNTLAEPSSLDHMKDLFLLGIQTEEQLLRMIEGSKEILCVDGTHSVTAYSFYLINFVVPDEFGQGYHVAYFITNR